MLPGKSLPPCRAGCNHGVVKFEGLQAYECADCNGTGIQGDARLGLLIIVVTIITTVGPIWYLIAH